MDKVTNILLALFFIFIGFEVLIIQKFSWRGSVVDFSNPMLHWPIGLIIIGFGLYIIFFTLFNSKNKNTKE